MTTHLVSVSISTLSEIQCYLPTSSLQVENVNSGFVIVDYLNNVSFFSAIEGSHSISEGGDRIKLL